jgi:hypothetical protein
MRLHQRDDEATSWFLASGERNLLLTLFLDPPSRAGGFG